MASYSIFIYQNITDKIKSILKRVKRSLTYYNLFEYFLLTLGLLYTIGWLVFVYLPRGIYSIICNFFLGEEIFFKDVIIEEIATIKGIDTFLSTPINNVETFDSYFIISTQKNKYIISIPQKDERFFPGRKLSLTCRRHWIDRKIYYFEKFVL